MASQDIKLCQFSKDTWILMPQTNCIIQLFCAALIAIIAPSSTPVFSQNLVVIKNRKMYQREVTADTAYKMAEIKAYVPGIVYDLKYATPNNFTGRKLYAQSTKTYLRKSAVQALEKAQRELNNSGYGLKIFDAYRPYRVTKEMWELVKDERYVANPAKGSGHNRGLAVDLTITDLKTGDELNMGTGFDNFTDTAHHTFTAFPDTIIRNRELLKQVMEKYGFNSLESEWWHYSWPNTVIIKCWIYLLKK